MEYDMLSLIEESGYYTTAVVMQICVHGFLLVTIREKSVCTIFNIEVDFITGKPNIDTK